VRLDNEACSLGSARRLVYVVIRVVPQQEDPLGAVDHLDARLRVHLQYEVVVFGGIHVSPHPRVGRLPVLA
jgi:hypothetical protein